MGSFKVEWKLLRGQKCFVFCRNRGRIHNPYLSYTICLEDQYFLNSDTLKKFYQKKIIVVPHWVRDISPLEFEPQINSSQRQPLFPKKITLPVFLQVKLFTYSFLICFPDFLIQNVFSPSKLPSFSCTLTGHQRSLNQSPFSPAEPIQSQPEQSPTEI